MRLALAAFALAVTLFSCGAPAAFAARHDAAPSAVRQ